MSEESDREQDLIRDVTERDMSTFVISMFTSINTYHGVVEDDDGNTTERQVYALECELYLNNGESHIVQFSPEVCAGMMGSIAKLFLLTFPPLSTEDITTPDDPSELFDREEDK